MGTRDLGISDFFSGKGVFITGGTGFLGKAVIEKLLRSCPEIGSIYILVRDKKGISALSRLEKLLSEPIFDVVRSASPKSFSKVIPIPGDVTLPGLGIQDEDLELLRETVSIVVHSAATVKFDEDLKVAVNINARGTDRVLELASTMKFIQAVVHVSTAFSNCDLQLIEEKVYPVRKDPRSFLDQLNGLSDEVLKETLPTILDQKPNTYTFTKHLAEELVNQTYDRKHVPVCIVRPSIVGAALKEPMPGFVDNFNGASGLLVGILTGAMHTVLLNDEYKLDVIPLDFITNCILAAAQRLGSIREWSAKVQVYNLTSYENPFVIPKIIPAAKKTFFEKPFKNLLWYPTLHVTSSYLTFWFLNLLVHQIPAHLLDAISGLTGRKKTFVRIYRRLSGNFDVVRYFTTRKWEFSSENTSAMYNALSPVDQINFCFDVPSINWDAYIRTYIQGLRKYALKDTSSADEGKRVVFKLQILHVLVTSLVLLPIFAVLVVLVNTLSV
ncbi:unnamed protein product [Allacma fusca]|uniref:Fatty acyl-CoA reductase n=1 Tax=Allacma fusca TaxID=39272 RepID=A0A8J2JHR6_9HEXA|nr:unnamed protein product [Allacma fusca]